MKKIFKSIIPLILVLSLFVACGGSSKPNAEQIKKDLVRQQIALEGTIESVQNVEIVSEEEQANSILEYQVIVDYTNSKSQQIKANFKVYYNNSDNKGWKFLSASRGTLVE